MRDNPMLPSQSVVYWTDYVLRYNGTQHLRTTGADMPLYQYLLLDIIAFLTAAIIFLIYLLIYISKHFKILIAKYLRTSNLNEGKKMR